MTAVDTPVREFSIAFYPPNLPSAIFFCIALALTLAAGAWFGLRLYLHLFGVRTEGTVTAMVEKSTLRSGSGEFSKPQWTSRNRLTIEYADSDGVKHIVKGTDYSAGIGSGSENAPRVGGKVPVRYSRLFPGCAMYYDPVWDYLVPIGCLLLAGFLTLMAANLCYKDIRAMNALSLEGSSEKTFRGYQDVIIECDTAIHLNPNDAAAYERRGDVQFAIAQFRDATADYGEALRLAPDRREVLRKRAKAEWLDGHDSAALRDWLQSR